MEMGCLMTMPFKCPKCNKECKSIEDKACLKAYEQCVECKDLLEKAKIFNSGGG